MTSIETPGTRLPTAEDKLKQLENSPNFARLRGEQLMLQSVRNLQLEPLIMCLETNRAQIDLNQYVQRASTNPGEFTRWLFEEMWRQVEGDFDRIMAEDLAVLRQASPQAMQSLASPDAVFVKLQRIAERNPSARCLVEYLAPRMHTLKQSSQALQGVLLSRATVLVEQKVKPILNELLVAQARGFMDELRRPPAQGTVATPSPETGAPPAVFSPPQQVPPPASTKPLVGSPPVPPQQTLPLQQDLHSTMGVVRKRGLETDSLPEQDEEITSRGLPAPRTIGSLVWEVVGPDDMKIIAQGVFGRHLLNTANMQQATTGLRELALAPSGSPARATTLRTLETVLRPNLQMDRTAYIDAGYETLRYILHKFLDTGGDKLVTFGVSRVEQVKHVLTSMGVKTCATPPAIAIPCSFTKMVADIAFTDVFVPASTWTILKGFHLVLDRGINVAREVSLSGDGRWTNDKLQRLREQAGPFAPLFEQIQEEFLVMLAEPVVRESRIAMQQYNASVLELARAHASK